VPRASDEILAEFDRTKEKVKAEIRHGFFNDHGALRLTETEVYRWISDRAVDEYRLVYQLSYFVQRAGHCFPPRILNGIVDQLRDEAEHYLMLSDLLPEEIRRELESRMSTFDAAMAADAHWTEMREQIDQGDAYDALLEINIVHEGFSAAAIEVLTDLPMPAIAMAYRKIGEDEQRHHEEGRDLLDWLVANSSAGSRQLERTRTAHLRAEGGAMAWSWPAPRTKDFHLRAVDGGAMAWSWPRPAEKAS
jgi:hypothetical protein